ncbi:MAG: PTS sugar transporter subunit IIA [Terrimicrobiaceae bacterium]
MTSISDILQPGHVNLALTAGNKTDAVQEVLAKLNGDARVGDFAALVESVLSRNAPAIAENGCGICLAHGRTDSVASLVLAAGRSQEGFGCDDVAAPVRLVFVAGIPSAFNAEYLRIVGAIARICRDKHQLDRLLAAKTGAQFVDLLGAGERKL